MFWDVFSSRYKLAMTDKDAQAGKAEGVLVPHDQTQPIEQRTEFKVQGFGNHNQRQGIVDMVRRVVIVSYCVLLSRQSAVVSEGL